MKNKKNTQTMVSTTTKMSRILGQGCNHRHAEANARRRVAKSWAFLAKDVKYQEAATKDVCTRTTQQIEDELFDGILLNLCEHNSVKSFATQKRILRRIVEKRQAQQAYRNIGRTNSRYANHMLKRCASISMRDIHRYQVCA